MPHGLGVIQDLLERQRKNQFCMLAADHSFKTGRKHANDRHCSAIDVQRAAQHVRAPGELLLPVVVSHERLVAVRPSGRDVVRFSECPAEERLQLEHAKPVAGHECA